MATIEKRPDYIEQPDEAKVAESVYDADHQMLFAAVKEGDSIREYRLSAGFTTEKNVRDAMPVVNGAIIGLNDIAAHSLGGFVEVVGVKAVYDQYWTPASAVYALRRTSQEVRTTRSGEIKQIDITDDSAHLGVMAPRPHS